jgi:large subunit ribosomal protein L24
VTLARIKKGDTVVVISGKERGKRGVVREVLPGEGRAIVQDLNISKRHRKPSGQTQQAGIIDLEQPIQLSNLMPADPRGGKPTRVHTRVLANGTKVRIALASGEQIGKE